MFSKFSEEAQKVLLNAKKEMQELKHPYVGSEHLFLSLLKCDSELSKKLNDFGITYNKFKDKLIELIGYGTEKNDWFLYTPLLKRVMETALLISKESSNGEVTTDHLLFAILEEGGGVAVRILNEMDIDVSDIQDYFSTKLSSKKKNNKKKLLVEEFGVDLTKKAMLNELDPVVGRDKEIKRIMEILCRRGKNNPLLIGDAGVGKTALVEELARLIVEDKVPIQLKNKRIISVSIATLVSGTKYRGEFEERVTKMLKELENSDNILLFIDEIHTLMGAGGAEGAIDAANIFKPALARGKIRLIGATTTDEYKQTIEKDRAMDRRFQTVFVYEPDTEAVYQILEKLKPIYEAYHGVKIGDDELKLIIKLSNKYIYDRKQPDKAIDILDEVCSKASISKYKSFSKLNIYKEELNQIVAAKNQFIIKQDFENAMCLKTQEKSVLSKINKLELKKTNKQVNTINVSDIAEVVSQKTNIPIYEINSSNSKYIKNLETCLKKKIIGQDEAITSLVSATKRIKLGYSDSNKPYSYLFVGPTGVGKTRLAAEYSNYLFGEDKLIRFDMSEYRDSSSITKIIGSAPGYVGYDDGNNKLEKIRKNPHAVVLLDEIEKAHPAVLNLFLQILDEGKITDSKGNTVYFNHHIIIMTSNVSFNRDSVGFVEEVSKEDSKLKDFLSLELLNRIQKVIYFNKLDAVSIKNIIKYKLDIVRNKFKEKNIKIHINDTIINKIIELSRYKEFGARRIDQVIEEKIDDYVIDSILEGKKEIYVNFTN
ncbi:MAG: ATP-dependent Clp protease ATP-binding subunit [Tenericutes bacterium]|nr:ATP-dependent Clp protease ATP-binding subunit [Mycoplasmatota bacterium]